MVSSTSTSNMGLKVCTTWAFGIYLEQLKYLMGQAQIPTISHQNLDHNITYSTLRQIPSGNILKSSPEHNKE